MFKTLLLQKGIKMCKRSSLRNWKNKFGLDWIILFGLVSMILRIQVLVLSDLTLVSRLG